MSFRRYEQYCDSGVEWIGEVPQDWGIVRVKDIVQIINGYPFDSKLFDNDVGQPLVRIRDLNAKDAEVRYAGEVDAGFEVTTADLLIGMDGDFNVGRWLGPEPALLNQRVCALRTHTRTMSRLLECALPEPLARINALTYSTTVKHLSSNQIGSIRLALPPSASDLEALVVFLDRETAKIDALVEEQRRLIELLREKRQAVISHAVTKGLDASAPMKESGVEWLGEVPVHWLVTPIRKVARLESGHTPSRSRPDWWENCTIPWFTLGDVWQIREAKRDYVYETKEMVSELGLANSSARLLPANTVMLSRTASVGFSAIMGVPMATTQDFANWVCDQPLNPDFLLQALRGMAGEFRRLMMGSTHNTIYMPDIQSLTMALPPLDEQEKIVGHIKLLAARYDELSKEAEAAIDLLGERRAALISAAVTGKIDVRSLATLEMAAA